MSLVPCTARTRVRSAQTETALQSGAGCGCAPVRRPIPARSHAAADPPLGRCAARHAGPAAPGPTHTRAGAAVGASMACMRRCGVWNARLPRRHLAVHKQWAAGHEPPPPAPLPALRLQHQPPALAGACAAPAPVVPAGRPAWLQAWTAPRAASLTMVPAAWTTTSACPQPKSSPSLQWRWGWRCWRGAWPPSPDRPPVAASGPEATAGGNAARRSTLASSISAAGAGFPFWLHPLSIPESCTISRS